MYFDVSDAFSFKKVASCGPTLMVSRVTLVPMPYMVVELHTLTAKELFLCVAIKVRRLKQLKIMDFVVQL